MDALRWHSPNRKRIVDIRYDDPEYVPGYDLDVQDFTEIVKCNKDRVRLSIDQDTRYGHYIMCIIELVLESPKFRDKDRNTKFEMRDQMAYELCTGLNSFNPDRGSSIFSYAYRIAYVAGIHYFKEQEKEHKKSEAIRAHCLEELQEYIEGVIDHKKRNFNKD